MRDQDELRAFCRRWYELWNLSDKQAWLDHWRAFAPGEPRIEDPVGKPVKRGWEMVEELWDRTITDGDHFKVQVLNIIACGDEVAVVCRTDGDFGGHSFRIESVDVHQFYGDSLGIRSYWAMEDMQGLPYGDWTAVHGETLSAQDGVPFLEGSER